MRFNKLLIILVLLLSFLRISAQEFELEKVSIKELQEKANPNDTSEVATILYKKARTFFVYDADNGFAPIHEYEFRIKIYKKEGLNWANFQVPYYVGYENLKDEVVKFSKGVTYNLEDGIIVKTKLNNEGNFNKKVNEYWSHASITMPNVKVGSVIEFKYTLKSENIVKFPLFNFQQEIPVNYSEYSTEIPEFFIYKTIISGFTKIISNEKLVNGFQAFHSNGSTLNLSYQQINTRYIAKNIPAIKAENYVDNIQNYRSSIQHELQKTRLPGHDEKNYSVTWDDVSQTIFENKYFGKELNEQFYFEKDLKTVIKTDATETEKVNSILSFLKHKMTWDNENGYLTEKGVKQAYIDRIGNVAEINFILISMLKYIGINASPVLLSTKDHGISVYPNRTIFNYVIAEAVVDGKEVLLDATNKNTTLNILPLHTLNWTGRIIRQNGTSEEINLVPTIISKEVVNLMADIDAQGKITGKVKDQYFDYNAFAFREKNNGISKDNYLEKLEKKYQGIEIGEYESLNNTDLSKPVIENYSFTHSNAVEIIGDKMYFSPMVFFTETQNPFTQETREYPVDFVFPHQDKYNISITIPDGYAIESIPQSKAIGMPDNIGNFKYTISNNGKQCQLLFTVDINQAIITPDNYEVLKNFYKEMIDKQNEKIVLKKA